MHLRQFVTAGVLAVAIPLGGCATMAQQQFQTMRTGLASTNANLEACVARERARPEFASLLSHLPVLKGRLYPTAAQLADATYPNADQALLLAQFTTSVAGCENAYRASVAVLLPAAASANDKLVADIDGVFAEWIARKITWGEGAQQINQIYTQDEPAVQLAATATMASLKAAHQQELAERQEFSNRLITGLATAAAIYAATHPQPAYVAPVYPPAPPLAPPVVQPTYCHGNVDRFGNMQATCN
jgi:hypothetical protein